MKPFLYVGIAAFAGALLMGAMTQNAFADGAIAPDGSNWGAATADFAPLGEHSSSQTEPRFGLGNLAQIFGSWCGLLAFLGFPCA